MEPDPIDIKKIIKLIIREGTTQDDGDALGLNIDALARKSGLNQDMLRTLHGPWFKVTEGGVVQLISTVEICPMGCDDKRPMFHICKYFILSDTCTHKPVNGNDQCKYGHELWDRGHNQGLLKQLMLDELDVDDLRVLFRLSPNRTRLTVPMVCTDYNLAGCNLGPINCAYLHLCRNYVEGREGCQEDCEKSHKVESVQTVLKGYGINVYRPPREILDNLYDLSRRAILDLICKSDFGI